MATILRVYSPSLQPLGDLPDAVGITQQVVHNDIGSLTATYPRSGVNSDLLDLPEAYLAVVVDGDEKPELYLYEEDTDQDDANPLRPISISARSYGARLEQAIVFPADHTPGANPNGMNPKQSFPKKTPGYMLNHLLTKAQTRGCFPELTWDFDATNDSSGTPWPDLYTIQFPAGQNYLDVLQSLVENEWCDFTVTGTMLRLFIRETALTADAPTVIYRLGKDCQLSTRARSRRGIANAVLGVGDERNMVYDDDPTSITQFGRREALASDGRMVTDGSLPQLVSSTLSKSARNKEGFSITVPVGERGNAGERIFQPGVDFTVGNYIRYDQQRTGDGTLTPLQVKTISYTWETAQSPANAVIEFNDLFVKWKVRQLRNIKRVTLGSSNATGTIPPSTTAIPDDSTPLPPTAVVLDDSLVYVDGAGFKAQAAFSWTPPIENTDGTDYTDHDHYQFQWQVDGGEWSQAYQSVDPAAVVQDLRPGADVVLRVRAVDTASPAHASDWLVSAAFTMPIDNTPPPKTSWPVVSSRLGTVTVTYDEKDYTGAHMPADYHRVVVHADTDPGFTPSLATEVGTILLGEGRTVISDLPYGDHTFKLVPYDTGGNAGPASDGVTIEVAALVDTDIIGEVIDGANIQPGTLVASEKIVGGSVTTELLAALAVEAGNVAANAIQTQHLEAGSVDVEKIKLGTFNTNLVPDPSFEQDYPVAAGNDTSQWRIQSSEGTEGVNWSVTRSTEHPRSGRQNLRIAIEAAGSTSTSVQVRSASMKVTPGETYVVTACVNKVEAGTSKFYLRLAGGSTPDCTEYHATAPGDAIGWDAEDPLFGENMDLDLIASPHDPDTYSPLTAGFVAPAGVEYVAIDVWSWHPTGASTIVVDDVSLVELGKGATEITSAGVRLFGEDGTEVAAFVANRPSYFSITNADGETLATIGSDGSVSGQRGSFVDEVEVYGRPLIGNYQNFTSPTEQSENIIGWLDQLPRGIVAHASRDGLNGTYATTQGLFEVSFVAERGRAYRVSMGSLRVKGTGNAVGLQLDIVLPTTADGEAASPTVNNGTLVAYAYASPRTSTAHDSTPSVHRVLRCNVNDGQLGSGGSGELNPGICKLFVQVLAGTEISTGARFSLDVEDIGPDLPSTTVINTDSAGGSSGGTTTVKTYTKTYNSTGWRCYRGSGSTKSGADDIKHGWDSYDGNSSGIYLFPSLTSDLSGATVKKVEVYLYATHWWYNSGGTGYIKAHGQSSLPSTRPSYTGLVSTHFDKPQGKWVTLPSSSYASFKNGTHKGIMVGPAPNNSQSYYGRFRTTAKLRVTYQK